MVGARGHEPLRRLSHQRAPSSCSADTLPQTPIPTRTLFITIPIATPPFHFSRKIPSFLCFPIWSVYDIVRPRTMANATTRTIGQSATDIFYNCIKNPSIYYNSPAPFPNHLSLPHRKAYRHMACTLFMLQSLFIHNFHILN